MKKYRLMLTPYEIEVVRNAVCDKLQIAISNRKAMKRKHASDFIMARNNALILAGDGIVEEISKKDLDALCYWEERECSVLQCLQGIQGMRNKEEAMNNALELFQKNQEEK